MLNPFTLRLVDGTFFFGPLAVASLGLVVLIFVTQPIVRNAIRLLLIAAAVLFLIAPTPHPAWASWVWGLCFIAALLIQRKEGDSHSPIFWIAPGAIFLLSLWLVVGEWRWYHLPEIPVAKNATVYIIGDSISAGIGEEATLWPEYLAKQTGLSVRNLAWPGAVLQDGLTQLAKIRDEHTLVFVELGGNDLLGNAPAKRFEEDLDRLLQALRAKGHKAVLFELPLPPLKTELGRIQRRLAEKYQVALIPRRLFAKVLTPPENTIDGLHLSDRGHQEMARRVAALLQ